ncbi:MAG: site-specific DNA-methyltransferase [Candidatus Heimdallarchaeota archaeon]|nr:site-specific DNA-methyltransferase [Candidatus Heimdallarchaeota archaeon]
MTLAINSIYNIDCREGLKQIDKESVDLLLTDPPFGISFDRMGTQYNRKQKNLGDLYTEIPQEEYFIFTLSWLRGVWDVLKPTGSGFIFSGWNNLGDILNAISEVGFRLVNHIIWKYQFGVYTKKKYVTSHYHILYFTKLPLNKDHLRTFNRISDYSVSLGKLYFEDVWFINRDYQKGGEKTPTRLPLALTDKCIRMGSEEGDLVLEPFLGSGAVIQSCMTFNRRYIGFEISPEIFQIARNRIEKTRNHIQNRNGTLENWLK